MNALIQYPSDNIIESGTVTIDVGTEDAEYPISAGVKNSTPGKWGKFNETTAALVVDFGSAKSIEVFGMPLYFISAGATVKLQGNASNSWGAPSLDVAITIPAHRLNGFTKGRLVDLSGVTNTFRYWRVAVTAGNSVPVQVGWLWFSQTYREFVQNVRWGWEEVDEKPQETHQTEFLWETHYPYGATRRSITGEVRTHEEDGAVEQYQEWTDAAGQSEYHLFSIVPEDEECWLMRHSEDYRRTRNYNDDAIPVRLMERAKGLRP